MGEKTAKMSADVEEKRKKRLQAYPRNTFKKQWDQFKDNKITKMTDC